jgi:hypothetical protein
MNFINFILLLLALYCINQVFEQNMAILFLLREGTLS